MHLELLAILGRGIQREYERWSSTRDLEIFSHPARRSPDREPAEDENQHCLIGGGQLNILAGRELCKCHHDTLRAVVCAYGGRSEYLIKANGPSESEVMSQELVALFDNEPHPEIIVWPHDRAQENSRGNTDQELLSIFELAVTLDLSAVAFVTIAAQFPRALLMAHTHLREDRFSSLKLQAFTSENVLLQSGEHHYTERIARLLGSAAYRRTMAIEGLGINRWLAGTYYDPASYTT